MATSELYCGQPRATTQPLMTTLGLQINDRIVCSVHFGLWTSDKRRRRTIGSYWSYGYSTHDSEKYYCVCGYVELGVILRIAFTLKSPLSWIVEASCIYVNLVLIVLNWPTTPHNTAQVSRKPPAAYFRTSVMTTFSKKKTEITWAQFCRRVPYWDQVSLNLELLLSRTHRS